MRKPYICCSATDELFRKYYGQQVGNGLPIFVGSHGQRGHGLGSILGGLFRSAFPLIKRGLATFGKHALRTGLEIANDVVGGEELKESAKRRVPQGIKSFAQSQNFIPQSGGGRKRKATKRIKRLKRRKTDIFE